MAEILFRMTFKIYFSQIFLLFQNFTRLLNMSQQSLYQTVLKFAACFSGIQSSIQPWLAKEIIDFDPFDDAAYISDRLLEEWNMIQGEIILN